MTAPLDIKKYREIAEKATPGPWVQNFTVVEMPINQQSLYQRPVCHCAVENPCQTGPSSPNPHGNAEFIATFNPETVLRLLDTIEKYEAVLKFYADRKNWAGESYKSECLDKIKNDIKEDGFACPSGGARAREALRGGKGDER